MGGGAFNVSWVSLNFKDFLSGDKSHLKGCGRLRIGKPRQSDAKAQDILSPDCKLKKNELTINKKNIAITGCLVVLYPA